LLGRNQLSGSIPASIGNLTSLTRLNLASNQLSGSIPSIIGNLASLTHLNLSCNDLAGPIPLEIGKLANLTSLVLRQNDLDGPIPSTIGNLKSLTRLNLASNRLSGSIPLELEDMINLKDLRVQKNEDLTGTFTPRCDMKVAVGNTDVTLCGCANSDSPVAFFPSLKTPTACLATTIGNQPAAIINKRAAVLTFTTLQYTFTCNTTPTTLRPYQDCINLISAYCQSESRVFFNWIDCHTKVLSVKDKLNSNWKSYINSCAMFAGGNPTSARCNNATNQILTNEYYVLSDGTNINVPLSVVEGAKYIWST